ncbi:MAG: sodium:proton antiporter [Thermodesulfobacteriota bacterium]
MHSPVGPTLAATITVGILCQWFAWRVKLPAIIFLLLAGIVAGPLLGILEPETLLGPMFFPFISLSVAVILFEGSLTLKWEEISGLARVVRNLLTWGLAVTWMITTLATRYALDFSWEISFLFGAVTVVTGPTVIVPMLRTVRPTASISNVLRWEGIVIDPLGASLAVLVYQFIVTSAGGGINSTLATLARIFGVGLSIGAACGWLFGISLRNHWLPEYLQKVASLALVLAAFAASNLLQEESGLVTVTVMGVWLANMKGVDVDEILDFKETLSVLLISLLFIFLAARIHFADFARLGWGGFLVFLSIQFLSRPLNVMVSACSSRLSWGERHMLAWIAPRGIVAAAVAALFALKLEQRGYPEADLLVPLTFLVIVGTVVLQSLTARPIAHLLGVAEPEPRGFLIIGANGVARAIGRALLDNGFRVLLAEANWDNIMKAKMAGLATYYGNPISEHAERNIDLVGIGRMLGLSPTERLNQLAAMHYRMELGEREVFVLRSRKEEKVAANRRVTGKLRGRTLFGPEVTFARLSEELAGGGEIRTTELTEQFGFEEYLRRAEHTVPLFAIDPRDRLHLFADGLKPTPAAGWKVIGLVPRQVGATDEKKLQ